VTSRLISGGSAVAAALLLPAGLVGLWSVASDQGWLPDQILPPPGLVWQTLLEIAASGDLWANTAISLQRVLEGFALGALAGLGFGLVLGLSRTARALFDPVFLFASQVPAIGWIPLLILVMGIDEAMKVTVIAWAAFVAVVLNVAQGIRDVPPALRELGRVLTFDPWDQLTRVVLPSAVPAIFTGLREGMANAWQTLVAAELFASAEGLGYLITEARQLFQLQLVLAMVIVLGVAGLILNGGFALIERRLLRWQALGA
jgi:sulfonate transport system permease protein